MFRNFLKFSLVGALGTAVHYLVLVIYVSIGKDPIIGSILGSAFGMATNYLLNYRFNYKAKSTHISTFPKFFVVSLIGMLLNAAIMIVLVSVMNVYYLLAQVVATALTLVCNFFGNHNWTFSGSAHEQ